MADPCPLCGANRDIVGKVHRCVPAVHHAVVMPPGPDLKAAKARVEARSRMPKRIVSDAQPPLVSDAPAEKAPEVLRKTGEPVTHAERSRRWREAHPEKHSEQQRRARARKKGTKLREGDTHGGG